MKTILISSILFFSFFSQCVDAQQVGDKLEPKPNTIDSFDIELLNIDIEMVKSNFSIENNIPLSIGVVGKRLIGGSFSVGKSSESERHYDFENSHKVFCNVVVLSDYYDTPDYSHRTNFITSRNHPNYLAMGYVKTQNQKIDYVTFIDLQGESLIGYAIVSGKLFNLQEGNTIVVIPQKDYSLRFLHINVDTENFIDINTTLAKELSKDYYSKVINSIESIE